jgi:predicted SAM-dependent methyltransferase
MKLHLGCGKKYIDGFKHVDLQDFGHIDYRNSVDNLSFAKDNSVTLIYAAHVLEHFGRNEYKNVLREWFRALKPNGILRLSVPSFEAIVRYYTKKEDDLEKLLGLLVGGQKVGEYDYHKIIFDKKLLTNALHEIGFINITEYDWRNTGHQHVDDFSQAYLPHMDKANGVLMSLNIEATKKLINVDFK